MHGCMAAQMQSASLALPSVGTFVANAGAIPIVMFALTSL